MKKSYTHSEIADWRTYVISSLRQMERDINVQSNNHAMYVSQVIFQNCNFANRPNFNLAEFEEMLREIRSRVYLIALPLEFYGDGFETFYPSDSDHKPYAVWVCMNGKNEMEETLRKHGITEIDNKVRLHSCGFLRVKSNNAGSGPNISI